MGKKARRKKTISLVANDIAQVPSNKLQATKKSVVHPSNPVALAAASAACAAVFLFAFFLASANGYARQAGEYLQRGNVQQGLAAMQKAAAYNPFSADYHTGLMRIYLATGKTRQAVEEAGAAAARSQYGAARQADLAQAYLAAGRYADAVTCARRALELAPYQIAWYETLAGICAAAGRGELQAGNKDAARQHLEEALQVPGMLQARVAGLGEEEKKLWRDAPMLAVTPRLQLGVGQARYLLGKFTEAEQSLQAALPDNQLKGEASLWLALVKEKQGKPDEAQKLIQEAGKINKNSEAVFKQLKALEPLK